jgi:NAD(P)H dehydrogenase (quinone)
MIAVVGATGNTGRAVVKELKALGENPVCIVRNADKAREVLGADAKVAVAELTDKAGLEKALQGVTRVFVVTGHNPNMVEQQNNVLDAALKNGAKYLVRVSGGPAVVGPDVASVVGRGHDEIEKRLATSGIGWTILRPGLFMQNMMGQAALIKSDSKVVFAYPASAPVALIDVRDTGAVGARIVRDPAPHAGKTYVFTGKVTNYGEFVQVLSQVLGRQINYVETSLEQLEQTLKSRNTPDWLVTHQLMISRLVREGGFSRENTQPVRDIAGREPITTRKFAEDFKGAFT